MDFLPYLEFSEIFHLYSFSMLKIRSNMEPDVEMEDFTALKKVLKGPSSYTRDSYLFSVL